MERLAEFWLRQRSALLVGSGIVSMLAIAGGTWWQQLTILPERPQVPVVELPHPNAYDYYVQAAELQSKTDDHLLKEVQQNQPIGALMPDCIAFLKANASTLQKLHEGFRYPYRIRPEWEQRAPFPLVGFHDSARLLALAGHVAEEQGRLTEANNYYLDTMRLGIDIPHGGDINTLGIGGVMERDGRSRMWGLANRLNGSDARSAAKRLEGICAQRVPRADALVAGKWHDETILWNMLQKDNPFRLTHKGYFLPDLGIDAEGKIREPKLWDYLKQDSLFLFRSERYIFNEANHLEDLAIEQTRQKPYSPHPQPLPPVDNPISGCIVPPSKYLHIDEVEYRDTCTSDALLLAKLALRAYSCDYHKYPSGLSTLVAKGYLSQIPVDPFSPTCAPVQFRLLSRGRYLLYSVGPDGKNDGGKATEFPLPRRAYVNRGSAYVEKDDTGDFVVGVDTP